MLLVGGEDDRLKTPEEMEKLQASIPGSQLVVLPYSRHCSQHRARRHVQRRWLPSIWPASAERHRETDEGRRLGRARSIWPSSREDARQ